MKNRPVEESSEKAGKKRPKEREKEEGRKERRLGGRKGESKGKEERFKELGFFCLEKTELTGQFTQARCRVQWTAQSGTLFLLNGKRWLMGKDCVDALDVLGAHRRLSKAGEGRPFMGEFNKWVKRIGDGLTWHGSDCGSLRGGDAAMCPRALDLLLTEGGQIIPWCPFQHRGRTEGRSPGNTHGSRKAKAPDSPPSYSTRGRRHLRGGGVPTPGARPGAREERSERPNEGRLPGRALEMT